MRGGGKNLHEATQVTIGQRLCPTLHINDLRITDRVACPVSSQNRPVLRIQLAQRLSTAKNPRR